MLAFFDLSSSSNTELYIWTGILVAIILGITIPVTIHQQKIVKKRWRVVSDFLEQHSGQILFRPHHQQQKGDILIPVFSGFLIHGNFAYICLDPNQDRQKALSFIMKLREVCNANNTWHFDYFTSQFYAWHYYRKATRILSGA